ncbi:MAG: Crp/Fnr family transcriptional regulator [Prevotellaceae bacterium]|nr:Crp/Fnr family transcriptional regulator [Candidatus Colivivens equi]MCQ2077134.1 hypothetical protein [Bacteroidaceae bacterium]
MEMQMIENMLRFPLFQGLSLDDFSKIIPTLKLDFERFDDGNIIVSQGETCKNIIYIIDGEYDIEMQSKSPRMTFIEHCNRTPYIIEPYNIFTVKRSYERTYRFTSKGETFSINKETFISRILTHPIVKSNFINNTCNQLRKLTDIHTSIQPMSIEEKIQNLINRLSTEQHSTKTIRINMDQLALCIQETRLNVSKVLNKWHDEGKINLRRSGFLVI